MKSFSIHQIRIGLSVLVVAVLLVATYMSNQSIVDVSRVGAAETDNISGWAWSGGSDNNIGIGWISFNCTNESSCATSNYGVNVDSTSGNFSGYAWSANVGWIHFAPAGPYPGLPNHSAKREGNTVTGWARVIATTGGFDGWIKLSDTNAPAYGVTINPTTGNFSGYAWGDSVLGWIDFAPVTAVGTGVKLTLPTCANGAENPPTCTTVGGVCLNSANNPPTCTTFDACANGATNPPTCTIGNGICDPGETPINTPQDCSMQFQQF